MRTGERVEVRVTISIGGVDRDEWMPATVKSVGRRLVRLKLDDVNAPHSAKPDDIRTPGEPDEREEIHHGTGPVAPLSQVCRPQARR